MEKQESFPLPARKLDITEHYRGSLAFLGLPGELVTFTLDITDMLSFILDATDLFPFTLNAKDLFSFTLKVTDMLSFTLNITDLF